MRFSNAIRFIVFLNTGKLVNDPLHPLHTITDKFYFVLKKIVVSGSCLHESEMCHGYVFQKWRDDPDLEITKKLFFCFIFGL